MRSAASASSHHQGASRGIPGGFSRVNLGCKNWTFQHTRLNKKTTHTDDAITKSGEKETRSLEANQTRINPTVVETKKRGPARRLLRGFTLRLPTPRRGLVSFFACALSLSLFCAGSSLANVSITAASGGTNISADKAADATSPGWVTLGSFVLNEGNKTDISAGSGQTLILKAPAGFQF